MGREISDPCLFRSIDGLGRYWNGDREGLIHNVLSQTVLREFFLVEALGLLAIHADAHIYRRTPAQLALAVPETVSSFPVSFPSISR